MALRQRFRKSIFDETDAPTFTFIVHDYLNFEPFYIFFLFILIRIAFIMTAITADIEITTRNGNIFDVNWQTYPRYSFHGSFVLKRLNHISDQWLHPILRF